MSSYTLAQLSDLLYAALDGNDRMYPQAQATAVLNETVCKLNSLLGANQTAIPLLTEAAQLVYAIPAGVYIPIKIYCEGKELEKYSLRQLGTRFRNWATSTTASDGPVARWAPIGLDQFVISPIDAIGGKLLEVQGVVPVTLMTAAGDEVDLDDDTVPTLIDHDRARIQLKLGGTVFAAASIAYQQFIREMKDKITWEAFKFPAYWISKQLEGSEGKGT